MRKREVYLSKDFKTLILDASQAPQDIKGSKKGGTMPPKSPPACTVALCGLRAHLTPSEIEEVLQKEKPGVQAFFVDDGMKISEPVKDRDDFDNKRHLVYLKCHSNDAAKKACTALNQIKFESLGIDKYGYILQAVLRPGIKSVDWKSFSKADRKTVEGKISSISNTHCFVSAPMSIWVPADAFSGGTDAWKTVRARRAQVSKQLISRAQVSKHNFMIDVN